MEQNYKVYTYRDELIHGRSIRLEHTISLEDENISDLVTRSKEEIASLLETSKKAEEACFEKLKEQAKEWEAHAAQTKLLTLALGYFKDSKLEHSNNQWKTEYYWTKRGNAVYHMRYSIYEKTKYNTSIRASEPVAYEASYSVYTRNLYNGDTQKIANQERKRFKTREGAEKYIQGRIKKYDHLFQEENPVVPKEYADLFLYYGVPYPGYRIEGINA